MSIATNHVSSKNQKLSSLERSVPSSSRDLWLQFHRHFKFTFFTGLSWTSAYHTEPWQGVSRSYRKWGASSLNRMKWHCSPWSGVTYEDSMFAKGTGMECSMRCIREEVPIHYAIHYSYSHKLELAKCSSSFEPIALLLRGTHTMQDIMIY